MTQLFAYTTGVIITTALYIAAVAFTGINSSTARLTMNENSPTTRPAAEACGIDENAACGTTHWKSKSDAEWRQTLTPEQYHIAREAGTERAFTGKYWNTKTKGIYHCALCNQPLFSSETKFDSGTGWPSFYKPLSANAVATSVDHAYGVMRTEVNCSQCGAHLGHIFDDGPPPTGLRYCLNSAVLNLVPDNPK